MSDRGGPYNNIGGIVSMTSVFNEARDDLPSGTFHYRPKLMSSRGGAGILLVGGVPCWKQFGPVTWQWVEDSSTFSATWKPRPFIGLECGGGV